MPVLEEHDDAEGVLLWRVVRDVELWAQTPDTSRPALLSSGAPVRRLLLLRKCTFPSDIRSALRDLNRILAERSDSQHPQAEAACACAHVSEWARDVGAQETALAFAQAAALASPREAAYAVLTAERCRDAGQPERAVTWYERAVGVARRGRDWRSYAYAFLGMGEHAERGGDPVRARRFHIRSFRVARRLRGAADLRAQASYRLFRLARDAGDVEESARWARHATRAVLKPNTQATGLALLLCGFWIDRGRPHRAHRRLAYLRRLDVLSPAEEARADVLEARAALAAGNREHASAAWTRTWRQWEVWIGAEAPAARLTSGELVDLARTAAEMGDADALRRAAGAALVAASEEEYPRVRAELRALEEGRFDSGPPLAGAA